MIRIELTEKEGAILTDMLKSLLFDLRTERVGTDNREWHAEFVEREALVDDLLRRLENKH